MKMNLKPALAYRFTESIRSLLLYFAIMVAVVFLFTGFFAFNAGENGDTTMSAYGASSAIAMFVVGICTIREHLRLCLQMGVSRRTAFVSEAISAVMTCLCLAAAGELIMAAAQYLAIGRANIHIFDMYQLLYVGLDVRALSPGQHLCSLFVNAALFIAGYAGGAFISIVLYRLSKLWKTVVCIGVPVLLIFVFPIAIRESGLGIAFSATVMSFMSWIGQSAVNWMLFFTGIAVVVAVFNWLLLRRAPIVPAVG